MKLLKRAFAAAALCLVLPVLMGAAGTEQHPDAQELTDLGMSRDIIVVVSYETQEPGVTLISPSGAEYTPESGCERVERGGSSLYMYINDAEAGRWLIDLDKKDASAVEVTVMPWDRPLEVESLTVTGLVNNTLTARATIVSGEDRRFEYDVFAVATSESGKAESMTKIGDGSGYTGREFEIRASTAGLMDGDYRLHIEAYYITDSGAEAPVFYTDSGTFTVTGNVRAGTAKELVTVLDMTDGELTLDWSGVEADTTVSGWTLEIEVDNPDGEHTGPYYRGTYERNETSDTVLVDRAEGDIHLKLVGAIRSGGFLSFQRDIKWDNGVSVEFLTPESTNALRGTLRFDAAGHELMTTLTVNGSSQQLRLSDSGELTFELAEMTVNEVSARYGWEDGIFYQVSHRISVDSMPPTLELYGVGDTVTVTEKKVSIAGGTEPGAAISVNSGAVTAEDDGSFIAELTLSDGENTVVFEARDPAGNVTSRTLRVIVGTAGAVSGGGDQDGGSDTPWVLIFTAGFALLAGLGMGIFGAVTGARCKRDGLGKGRAIRLGAATAEGLLCASSVSAGAIAVVQALRYGKLTEEVSGSNLPVALGKYTTKQLAEIISRGQAVRSSAVTFAVISIVAAALFIGAIVAVYLLKRRWRGVFCPYCGAPVERGETFCGNCGADFSKK